MMKRVVAAVDVLLAGHMHISHAAPTAIRYKLAGNSAVFVQAGTALSTTRPRRAKLIPGSANLRFQHGSGAVFGQRSGGGLPSGEKDSLYSQ